MQTILFYVGRIIVSDALSRVIHLLFFYIYFVISSNQRLYISKITLVIKVLVALALASWDVSSKGKWDRLTFEFIE